MKEELLTTVKETIAQKVFGSAFAKLHGAEASNVSAAAHAVYKDVLAFAKDNPTSFDIDVAAAMSSSAVVD